MEKSLVGEGHIVVDRALLEQMLESGERVVAGLSSIVDGLRAMKTIEPPSAAAEPPAKPAEPRVWNTSDDALAEYDAEQLVRLRADHRGDNHDAAGCHICDVLVKRLGSL